MDLKVFWDKREPLHRWSLPETELHKRMMGDLVEWIRFMASENTWPRILDVGCGSGRLFTTLSNERVEADVTMVDFVDVAVSLCEESTGHRPDRWDGEVLPYEDGSFDLVVLMDFLLHIPPDKVRKIMSEVKRVSNCYIYANTTVWDQKKIEDDTWCFSHNYTEVFDTLIPVLQKSYPAKKELTAYLFRLHREEKTIIEVMEEQFDADFSEVEREDDGSTGQDSASSSDESSLSDDPEVG